MREREMDFYRFGGCVDYRGVIENRRVPGVDKRLVLVIPTQKGHREVPLTDLHPSSVAKMLGISIEIVMERIRVLTRRREVGRTGIFLCESIPTSESFEHALKEIASRNPAVRRRLE
jgi:predicted nucleotidyltransferase